VKVVARHVLRGKQAMRLCVWVLTMMRDATGEGLVMSEACRTRWLVSQKKYTTEFLSELHQILTDFQNLSTDTLCNVYL